MEKRRVTRFPSWASSSLLVAIFIFGSQKRNVTLHAEFNHILQGDMIASRYDNELTTLSDGVMSESGNFTNWLIDLNDNYEEMKSENEALIKDLDCIMSVTDIYNGKIERLHVSMI